jgi:hypothetical protein
MLLASAALVDAKTLAERVAEADSPAKLGLTPSSALDSLPSTP